MLYFDPLYLIFILPSLFISLMASILLRIWTNEYLSKPNTTNLTGYDAVHKIATEYGFNISLAQSHEKLSDHYDPSNGNLTLSQEVAHRPTVGSIAIAAHEMGHVMQHQKGSMFMSIRRILVPITNIGTNIGYIFIVLGIILAFANLAWLGIILFSLSTLFSLLTLPIEIDASKKALEFINKQGLLSKFEIGGAKKVLIAASLTYVAGTISSLSNLIYFIFRVQGIGGKK